MKNYFLLFFICTLIATSCSKTELDKPADDPDPPSEDKAVYDPTIAAIFNTNCVNCHGGNTTNVGVTLTNYDEVKLFVNNGRVLKAMTRASNPMPPSGRLSDDIVNLIKKWKDDGFPKK